jgi:hypothetical protein
MLRQNLRLIGSIKRLPRLKRPNPRRLLTLQLQFLLARLIPKIRHHTLLIRLRPREHSDHLVRVKEGLEIAEAVAGGDGDVALPVGVGHEEGRAGHVRADADADPLVGGGEGYGDEDVA